MIHEASEMDTQDTTDRITTTQQTSGLHKRLRFIDFINEQIRNAKAATR